MEAICTILVVTYNPSVAQIAQWTGVLGKLDARFNKVLVINSLQPSSAELALTALFDEHIINSNENALRGAYSKGLDYVMGRGINWCFFCDQDSIFDSSYFEGLLKYAVDNNFHDAYAYFGSVRDGSTGMMISPYSITYSEKYRRVSFPINSGLLVNVPLVLRLGGVNKRLEIDYIDTDLWMRMESFGFYCVWVEEFSFSHSIGRSVNLLGRRISLDTSSRYKSRLRSLFKLLGYTYIPLSWWFVELSKVFGKLAISVFSKQGNL